MLDPDPSCQTLVESWLNQSLTTARSIPWLLAAVETDDEFLYSLHRAVLGNVVEATRGPRDDSTQRGFHDDSFDPNRVIVALVDGEVAGVIDTHQSSDTAWYVSRIEIMPTFQGRGLGTRLMHRLIEDARAADLCVVELDVLQVNVGARRLYERLGFLVVREEAPKQRTRLELWPSPNAGGQPGPSDSVNHSP